MISLLAACGPKSPQTDTTDGATSTGGSTSSASTSSPSTTAPTTAPTTVDPTTGVPNSTGADSSGGAFMLPPDEGVPFITPVDGGGCGCGLVTSPGLRCKLCDPWVQDCPPGEKCSAHSCDRDDEWESQKCVPLDPDPDHAGEPCTVEGSVASGVDSCDLASMCWFIDPDTLTGTCVPRCTGAPDAPVCPDGTACLIDSNGALNLCLPTCDPLGADCGPGLCIPNHANPTDFVCVPDDSGAGGQIFGGCDFADTCDPGLVCADTSLALECDAMSTGCCLPFCDLTKPAPCPGAMQQCLPFFDEPPPGHEDLGVCGIPE